MDTEGQQQVTDHRKYRFAAPVAGVLLFCGIFAVMLGLSDIFLNR